jgi:HKD family nuclease
VPNVKILDPLFQFDGTDRYLARLKSLLDSSEYNELFIAVAYAKAGGVARIYQELNAWRSQPGIAKLIVGIDQKGTSLQALQLAQLAFDEVSIAHTGGTATFHPKFAVLAGASMGKLLIGSHNLTSGGFETNLEAGVEITYDLQHEAAGFQGARDSWDRLRSAPFTSVLDATLLQELIDKGSICDERTAKRASSASKATNASGKLIFARIKPAPASAIPSGLLTIGSATSASKSATKSSAKKSAAVAKTATKASTKSVPPAVSAAVAAAATSLVMEINPHDNGETFLSKIAVTQNPVFFGYPFTGATTPKKATNKAYPQRFPDPVVNVRVYGKSGKLIRVVNGFNLNTVYYTPNAEIRVTLSQHIRDKIKPFAVLHMQKITGSADYLMEIYNPGSARHAQLLAACDQTMPSGGRRARKFGWT